jgi:photosystem II stability/assembly factor-like uncharacterized protein
LSIILPLILRGKDTLFGIDFIDSENGVVSGVNGTILRTKDGGKTWERLDTGLYRDHLYTIVYNPSPYLKGERMIAAGRGLLLFSYTGGDEWAKRDPPKGVIMKYTWIFRLKYSTMTDVWAVGEKGLLWKSEDGGTVWEEVLYQEPVKERE